MKSAYVNLQPIAKPQIGFSLGQLTTEVSGWVRGWVGHA